MNSIVKKCKLFALALIALLALTAVFAITPYSAKADDEPVPVPTKYNNTYGTWVDGNSGSSGGVPVKDAFYNKNAILRFNSAARKAYMQFDLSEFLGSAETITKVELVVNITTVTGTPTANLRYTTDDAWETNPRDKDGTPAVGETKDYFSWNSTRDATTVSKTIDGEVVTSVASLFDADGNFPFTVSGLNENRIDITNIINYIKTQGHDSIVSFVFWSGSSDIQFSSQNATDPDLRPYIEFNHVAATAEYNITLDSDANGKLVCAKDKVSEGGSANISVVPNVGYELDTLTVNSVDKKADVVSYVLALDNITEAVTVAATFKVSTDNTKIYPVADAFVVNTTTDSTANEIRVKTAADKGSSSRIGFMKFDISGYDPLDAAVLNMYAEGQADVSAANPMKITAYGLNYTDWDESSITWAGLNLTRKVVVSEADNTTVSFAGATKINAVPLTMIRTAGWYKINLGAYLRDQKAIGATEVTIAFTANVHTGYMKIFSKENDTIAGGQLTRPYISFQASANVSVTADVNGSVFLNGGDIANEALSGLDLGANVSAEFTPESGYALKSVMVNGTDVTAKVTGNTLYLKDLQENAVIAPVFTQERTITVTVSDNVVVLNSKFEAVSGEIKIADGAQLTLYFVPAAGYKVLLETNGLEADGFARNKYTIEVLADAAYEVSAVRI